MDPDEGLEDEGPFAPLLPPDDRLWRHPSEVGLGGTARAGADGGASSRGVFGTVASGFAGAGDVFARNGARRVWAVAVVAGVVGALTASGIGILTGAFEQQMTVVRSVTPQAPAISLAYSGSPVNWEAVDDTLAPSVVGIDVSSDSGPVIGSGMLFIEGATGSYVITESSLVSDGGTVKVSFLSGSTARGKVIGEDPVTGLALLWVPTRTGIFPTLGSVADLQVAEPVLVVGARTAPGGSVFAGSVTGEDREVDLAGGNVMENMIAATTSSLPDAAGGAPIVDGQGRVVGITVSVDPTDASDQGLTFAVPIDVAEHVAQQILTNGSVAHPWLGVTDAVDLSSAVAHQLGLAGGAQIGQVSPGSPATRVGLAPSDIITSFNGLPVTSTGALTRLLSECAPGKAVPISFIHDGLTRTETLVVSNQPGGD